MRKLYPPLLAVICILCFINTQAQKKFNKTQRVTAKPSIDAGVLSPQGTTADCDTINMPVDTSWAGTTYTVNDQGDFVNGTNSFGDKQKANFFDLSDSVDKTYLTSVFVAFGSANSSVEDNLSDSIFFRVYEDNAGVPGTLLASEGRTLSDIKDDVEAGLISEIGFTTPVALPDSRKFYVSVDLSNFAYPSDSIWVAGTEDSTVLPNLAWEQWSDDTWHAYNGAGGWGLDIVFWIFPSVATSETGCSALPVTLISFNAQRNNKDVTLNWQIADEFGMKGYEVERSDNNGSYRTVATVAALNNAKNQSYSAIDKNAFTISPTVQYRLKQIDGDGSINYSRVINVKSTSSISDISFANPFNGALKVQLNLATSQLVSAYLYDMQGKLVARETPKMYNAASNTITMASTANLQRGMYVLKVMAGTDQAVYKVVKQ